MDIPNKSSNFASSNRKTKAKNKIGGKVFQRQNYEKKMKLTNKKQNIMETTSTIYRGYELIRTSYEFSIEMSSAADVEFYKNLACNCPENGYLLTNDNGYVV